MITTKSMRMLRGATKVLTFTVKDSKAAIVDLTGASAYLTVRTDLKAATPSLAKTSAPPAGIVIQDQTGALKGQFTATIDPADTKSLAPGDYYWDVWVVTATGRREPVVATSRFTIFQEVTVIP